MVNVTSAISCRSDLAEELIYPFFEGRLEQRPSIYGSKNHLKKHSTPHVILNGVRIASGNSDEVKNPLSCLPLKSNPSTIPRFPTEPVHPSSFHPHPYPAGPHFPLYFYPSISCMSGWNSL